MATLKAVDEEAQDAGAVTVEMIAAALERRKAEAVVPLAHHDEETGGTFFYRKLTGAEVRACRAKATKGRGTAQQRVEQDDMEFFLVNMASVTPKITQALWGQLGQLGPLVQSGIIVAIMESNGLAGDPEQDAKNDSSESLT